MWTRLVERTRDNRLKALTFIGNFAIARLVVYLVPLAIAAIAAPDVYGGVELAQSIAALGAALFAGAPLAGVSQDYLVRRQPLSTDLIGAAICTGSLLAVAIAGTVWLLNGGQGAVFACLSLGLAIVHNSASSVFRTLSWRNVTAWTDGTFILTTFAIVGLSILLTGSVTLDHLILGNLFVCLAGACGGLALFIRARRPDFADRATRLIRFGGPVVVSSGFAFWQAGSGRMLTGIFLPNALAAYGLAFRIAGLALGFHQLAVTAFFARIYSGRTRTIDRLLSLFLIFVVGALIVITVAARLLVGPGVFSALDEHGLALFHAVLPIVALQIFFWIANAMVESRLTRFGLAARTILPSLLINGLPLLGLFVLDRVAGVSLSTICWAVALQSAAYFATGCWLLARRRVPHRLLALVGGIGGLVLVVPAIL